MTFRRKNRWSTGTGTYAEHLKRCSSSTSEVFKDENQNNMTFLIPVSRMLGEREYKLGKIFLKKKFCYFIKKSLEKEQSAPLAQQSHSCLHCKDMTRFACKDVCLLKHYFIIVKKYLIYENSTDLQGNTMQWFKNGNTDVCLLIWKKYHHEKSGCK